MNCVSPLHRLEGTFRRQTAAVGVIAALCGCAPSIVLIAPAAPLRSAWGIAVYPVVFRFQASSYESFVRGRDIADLITAETNCVAFGPGEFRMIDPDDDDPRHGTTIGSSIRFSEQHLPPGLFALRTVVNRTIAESAGAEVTDTSGRVRGIRKADMNEHVTVRVELLSASQGGIVAQLEKQVGVNLLGDSTSDPFPEITRVTNELVRATIQVAGLPANRKPGLSGLQTIPVLHPALVYAPTGGESLQSELSRMDALDAEARVLNLMTRQDPGAPRLRQRLYQHEETGLVVTSVTDPAMAGGLQPDDVLVAAGGEPLLGWYALARHLADGATKLAVKRGKEEIEVTVQPALVR